MPFRSKRARERQSLGQFALALQNVDGDVGLALHAGGEVLGRRRRNRGVAMNDLHHAPSQRLNAERQRRHIEQQHFLGSFGTACQDVRLHGRAQRNHFVGIQVAMGRALE